MFGIFLEYSKIFNLFLKCTFKTFIMSFLIFILSVKMEIGNTRSKWALRQIYSEEMTNKLYFREK
jgi:hypothetical protein